MQKIVLASQNAKKIKRARIYAKDIGAMWWNIVTKQIYIWYNKVAKNV